MGKSLGLIQIAQMAGLCDDLDLTSLCCSQQPCLPFAILPVVFSIHKEDGASESPQEGMEIVSCQFAIDLGHGLPEKPSFELRLYYILWEPASKRLFLHPGETLLRK